jgi:hypothetical protein
MQTKPQFPFRKISTVMSRVERVIMLSIIRLLLNMLTSVTPILWATVIVGSVNMICMTILHTMKSTGSSHRAIICVRRVTLFVFSHAVMRATMADTDGSMQSNDAKDQLMTIMKGIAVLSALTLMPKSIAEEDDGEQFTSQIVYAFSTNVGGVLHPIQSSRVFPIIVFLAIVASSQIRGSILHIFHNARLVSPICDVANLVFFDAFTTVTFVESGDSLCDIAIIIGIFGLLWNFQSKSPDLQNVQQFTTWRTAAFITKIFSNVGLSGHTLSILIFVTVSLASYKRNERPVVPWLEDLLFLVGLNAVISDVSNYVIAVGDAEGLPVLLSVIVIIATINGSISYMSSRALAASVPS